MTWCAQVFLGKQCKAVWGQTINANNRWLKARMRKMPHFIFLVPVCGCPHTGIFSRHSLISRYVTQVGTYGGGVMPTMCCIAPHIMGERRTCTCERMGVSESQRGTCGVWLHWKSSVRRIVAREASITHTTWQVISDKYIGKTSLVTSGNDPLNSAATEIALQCTLYYCIY